MTSIGIKAILYSDKPSHIGPETHGHESFSEDEVIFRKNIKRNQFSRERIDESTVNTGKSRMVKLAKYSNGGRIDAELIILIKAEGSKRKNELKFITRIRTDVVKGSGSQ